MEYIYVALLRGTYACLLDPQTEIIYESAVTHCLVAYIMKLAIIPVVIWLRWLIHKHSNMGDGRC